MKMCCEVMSGLKCACGQEVLRGSLDVFEIPRCNELLQLALAAFCPASHQDSTDAGLRVPAKSARDTTVSMLHILWILDNRSVARIRCSPVDRAPHWYCHH